MKQHHERAISDPPPLDTASFDEVPLDELSPAKQETEPVEEGRYKGYVKELADLEKAYEVECTPSSEYMPISKAANGRRRR